VPKVTVLGRQIEVRLIPGAATGCPPLVFLHEGLGSVSMWRDFPDQVARRVGAPAMVYSRFGYGQSDGLVAQRTPAFMHDEALQVLPALLRTLKIEAPILIGHSDGASIALINAASKISAVTAVVLMAPHVLVEQCSLESIARVTETYETTDLKQRLTRHHARVDDAFLGWSRVWLDPRFRTWNLGRECQGLHVPTLLIQGEDDEYGTVAQLDAITDVAPGPVQRVVLSNCGHSPHRDQPSAVLDAISGFIERHKSGLKAT
jgi:pimeloyl-ACP methyl ester carboxylesterase